jgi:hypothetical protein
MLPRGQRVLAAAHGEITLAADALAYGRAVNEGVVALIAALGAALLTAGGSLGVVFYQVRLRGKSAESDAMAATETAKFRSGEGVDVATRQRKPVDLFELHDWLDQDFGPLRTAWSEPWSRGDQQLVAAGNRLMSACADVVTAATDTMPAPTSMSSNSDASYVARSGHRS